MTHQRLEKGGTEGSLARASSQPLVPASWLLPPSAAWVIAVSAGLAGALYLRETEGDPASLFSTAVLLTIGALVVAIFRRLLPSVVLVSAMVATIRTAAYIKQQATEVLLHAWDVVSLLGSWSTLSHFWHDHRQHALGLMAAVVATALLTCIAYRIDSTRIPRRYAAGAAALFFSLACLASAAKGERRHTEFYLKYIYVSWCFPCLLGSKTIAALWRGGMIEAARGPAAAASKIQNCEPGQGRQHIILIHQESVVPPSHFPSLSYDRSLDPFFHSYDGQLRKLRVETYGGASWLTEFSVLTGLSTYSFGGMRQFVQQVMAGKGTDVLPRVLALMRLDAQRGLLSDASPLPRGWQVLRGRGTARDIRRQGPGSQIAQRT